MLPLRVMGQVNKSDRLPPYPCKYCPGEELHWGRDCPRLAELERTKETKHKLAAVTHQTLSTNKGFALGVQAAPQSSGGAGGSGGGVFKRVTSCLINYPLCLMSSLTGRVWMNALLLICMLFTITVSSAGSILAAMTAHKSTSFLCKQ